MVASPRRHQTCHFRQRATSVPAEGPAYGLDFARHCEFPLRALQAQKWHIYEVARLVPPDPLVGKQVDLRLATLASARWTWRSSKRRIVQGWPWIHRNLAVLICSPDDDDSDNRLRTSLTRWQNTMFSTGSQENPRARSERRINASLE